MMSGISTPLNRLSICFSSWRCSNVIFAPVGNVAVKFPSVKLACPSNRSFALFHSPRLMSASSRLNPCATNEGLL